MAANAALACAAACACTAARCFCTHSIACLLLLARQFCHVTPCPVPGCWVAALQALEGPAVPVDAVMDVVMFSDLSPAAVAFGCAELDAGRMPPSANGVEVPQVRAVWPCRVDVVGALYPKP